MEPAGAQGLSPPPGGAGRGGVLPPTPPPPFICTQRRNMTMLAFFISLTLPLIKQ